MSFALTLDPYIFLTFRVSHNIPTSFPIVQHISCFVGRKILLPSYLHDIIIGKCVGQFLQQVARSAFIHLRALYHPTGSIQVVDIGFQPFIKLLIIRAIYRHVSPYFLFGDI